jgi:hypothetical protein
MAILPSSDVQSLAPSTQSSARQEPTVYFDPTLAELNSDLFDMDWSSIDWGTMSGMGSIF